jgi:hypothetical protein
MPLEEAACLALSKGLNYIVTPTILLVEDILCGVEKGIAALPEETAKKVQQETVRNLKGLCKPKDNLTRAVKRALWALNDSDALTVLPNDKGNVTVVLDTADYNWKIGALLENQAYRKLKKDPTESVECKTVLLLKKSSISQKVCQQIQLQGSRPRDCMVCRRSISKLGSHNGNTLHHVHNSTGLVHSFSSFCTGPQDIEVSFEVVLLFTIVQIRKTTSLLNQHFEDILKLIHYVLMSSYFGFTGQFDEQIDGVALGSLLFPVTANFFMEDFEEMVLDQAALSSSAHSVTWTTVLSSGHMAPTD